MVQHLKYFCGPDAVATEKLKMRQRQADRQGTGGEGAGGEGEGVKRDEAEIEENGQEERETIGTRRSTLLRVDRLVPIDRKSVV